MSQAGEAERMGVLRQAIARIEAGGSLSRTAVSSRPRAGVCEILPGRSVDAGAACGFALSLAIAAAGTTGLILWIAEDFVWREQGAPYGPGLSDHGLDPCRLALVRAPGPRQALWALEEALKSGACAAVVGEVWEAARHCDLAATRRLAVAARAGGALGLLLHHAPVAGELSTAARERFEVSAATGRASPSAGRRRPIPEEPVWSVRTLKSRPAAGMAAPLDRDATRTIVWGNGDDREHEEGLLRDALPLHRHWNRARA